MNRPTVQPAKYPVLTQPPGHTSREKMRTQEPFKSEKVGEVELEYFGGTKLSGEVFRNEYRIGNGTAKALLVVGTRWGPVGFYVPMRVVKVERPHLGDEAALARELKESGYARVALTEEVHEPVR